MIRKIMCYFEFHAWKWVKYEATHGTAICSCGGWKMFHTNEGLAGDCGSFHPYKVGWIECIHCRRIK